MIGGRQAARPTSDRDALVPAVMRRSRAAGNAPWDPDPELEMPAPFRWTAVLFAALGALAALDAALVGLGLVPTHAGLLWLRVHLVTLGLLAELAFGLLPGLVALATGGAVPVFRPGRWLLLNLGLLTLMVGIPLVRRPMIALGGTLVLAATVWLILELWRQRPAPAPDAGVQPASGRRFYLAALLFLVVGGLVGTGLWLGWGPGLGIRVPRETHIHANIWGFASLLMAGLLVDLAPALSDRAGLGRRAANLVLGSLSLGAGLLLVAPWTGLSWLMLPGILLYILATALLYRRLVLPLFPLGVGARLLLTSYLWILLPALALPLIVLGGERVSAARLEPVGPSILTYGWLLPALLALAPAAASLVAKAAPTGRVASGSKPEAIREGSRMVGPPRLGGSERVWVACSFVPLALAASIGFPELAAPARSLAFVLLAGLLASFARTLMDLPDPADAAAT